MSSPPSSPSLARVTEQSHSHPEFRADQNASHPRLPSLCMPKLFSEEKMFSNTIFYRFLLEYGCSLFLLLFQTFFTWNFAIRIQMLPHAMQNSIPLKNPLKVCINLFLPTLPPKNIVALINHAKSSRPFFLLNFGAFCLEIQLKLDHFVSRGPCVKTP